MRRGRVLLAALAGASLLGGAPASADTGVSIDIARIAVSEELSPGGEYRLPAFRVRNPGTEPTTYRLGVTQLEGQAELLPSESWFRFAPTTFTLATGESRVIATQLDVPSGADPGEYSALVGPQIVSERSGARVGAAAAARLTFDVKPSSDLDAWWREAERFLSEHTRGPGSYPQCSHRRSPPGSCGAATASASLAERERKEKTMRTLTLHRVAVVLASATAALLVSSAAGAATVTTVMSGLDNPRGLAFGPEGALYVAEAGRGGAGPCTSSIRPQEPGQPRCYGASGAVSRLWRGAQEEVVTGLPSYVNTMGQATGPHDVAMLGRGNAWVSVGWGADPNLRDALGAPWTSFDRLARADASGGWGLDTDIGAYEVDANPDEGVLDSNPYGLLAVPGQVVVADAGANALLAVDANGAVSTIATLPSRAQGRPTDAVPTAVAIGPDGAYYLAQLTGVPFTAGVANVYRIVPGEAPTIAYTGFTTIIDLAVGEDGSLYVLEHSTGPVFFALPGRLVRIAPDGTRTTIVDGLNRPGSVAVGPHGALYVSVNSISVGTGQVLRIEP